MFLDWFMTCDKFSLPRAISALSRFGFPDLKALYSASGLFWALGSRCEAILPEVCVKGPTVYHVVRLKVCIWQHIAHVVSVSMYLCVPVRARVCVCLCVYAIVCVYVCVTLGPIRNYKARK